MSPSRQARRNPNERPEQPKKKVNKKERMLKRFIRYRLQLVSLPVILVYFELLMILFRGNNYSFFYPTFFALGIGFVINALLPFLPKKLYLWVKGLLIFGIAVVFITECLIRSSFQQYMPFNVILHGAEGITKQYSTQLFYAIFAGLPLIILYMLPLFIFILIYKKWRLKTYQPIIKKLFTGGIGVLLILIAFLVAIVGKSSSIYKESYSFDNATKKFGLLTSIRLETKYAIFGNKYQSDFVVPQNTKDLIPVTSTPTPTPTPEPEETVEADAEVIEEPIAEPEPTGPVAYEDLNIMNIDFNALIEGHAGDEVLQQMDQYVSSLSATHKNNYTGAFAGKNLIMITAEALSDCAVDPYLTPTLYRLVNNGIKFGTFFQPSWGGSTSTGEFSFLTGIIPLYGEETILDTQNNNLYFTLGNALQRQNYWSSAYHNGNYTFYKRHLTHQNLGYSTYYGSIENLETITGVSYPSDSVTFDATMNTYLGNSPFSVYYMTLSGHSNYVPNAFVDQYIGIVNEYYGDRYLETTKYYLCYQMELDRALNIMVTKLEEAGIADNTVIALCPDHYPYGLENSATFGNDQDYLADLYGYVYNNWLELDHSCAVIWSECMEKDPSEEGYVAPTTISSVTYSIDLVPTLLNLFGIEYDSRLLPGRDVLDPTTEGFVVWANHSWLTDYVYHDSTSGNNFLVDGSGQLCGPEWDEYIAQKTAEANNKILYSGRVVTRNYFGVLFGEDVNQ